MQIQYFTKDFSAGGGNGSQGSIGKASAGSTAVTLESAVLDSLAT